MRLLLWMSGLGLLVGVACTMVGLTYTELVCASNCTGMGNVPVCGSDPSVCQGGDTCQQSDYLPDGYMICDNP